MSQEQNIVASARVIPVFPLPNVVFFPKVHLPLHIFEPRYRQMVRDVMADHRTIGMALLRGDWGKNYRGNPEIYPVGCLGEIVSATPFPDGRYNIVLYGSREYEIQEHILDKTPYRQAKVLLREGPNESEPALLSSLKGEILNLVQQIEEEESEHVNILKDPSLDEETWLNFCCFSLPISNLEKQSLLEAKSLKERAISLVNVLHFKIAEQGSFLNGLKESKERRPVH